MATPPIKHLLEINYSDEYTIGLIKCSHSLPDHEFFFLLNASNSFFFERKNDLLVEGVFFDYYFSVFEAYCESNDVLFRFFANSPSYKAQKKEILELFSEESDEEFLFTNPEISYVTTCSYNSPDFSLILQPEKTIFQLENHLLFPEDRLFHLIQYYE